MKQVTETKTLTPPAPLTLDVPIIVVNKEALERKADLLELAGAVVAVGTQSELEVATERRRGIQRLLTEVETTRKAVKSPVINLGKRIDEIAEQFCLALNGELTRIKGLMDGFARAEDKRVQKDQQELQRQQAEAAQKAQAAQDDAERIANLKKPSAKQEIAAQVRIEESVMEVNRVQIIAPTVVSRAAGLTIKKEVLFEIENVTELYKVRPEWFTLEPKRSVIKQSISKETSLPGLRVWESIGTGTRG